MPSKAKIMVLALDAADPGLVLKLARAGEMPAVAGMLKRAAAVRTRAPVGVFVSANWPTIFTATYPDKHAYLCWNEYVGGTYDYRETDPTMVRGTPFWETLSDAGRRVAVLDVPHTIVRPLNGVMVAEWGCHDRHLGPASWPAGLVDELSARHGRHLGMVAPPGRDQFAPCDYVHRDGDERSDEESIALFEDICAGIGIKQAASLELLDRGGWDLFMNVMGESHCVGHQLWHLHDPSHERHDPSLAHRVGGDPVREVYRRLDGVVAEHLARVGPDDTAYLLFAHGMTAHHDGTHLLDHVLQRLDWALDDPAGLGRGTRALGELARLVPAPLRPGALRAAAPLLRGRTRGGELPALPALGERRWFSTPNNTVVGAVRLSLAGREPSGRVHPADRRDVLRWLSARLRELVNVDSGGRVVRRCVIADDVYRRSPGDAFADLYVEWERSAPIERVWSPSTGTVALPYDHWRQGDHVREGLMLACGPGIRRGRRRGVFHTADLGATFAAAAGVELMDVDGRPIAPIVPSGGQRRRTSRPGSPRRVGSPTRVERALDRAGERRAPAWARRQDPALRDLRSQVSERLASLDGRAEAAEASAGVLAEDVDRVDGDVGALAGRVEQLERYPDIAAMAAWLPHAEVPLSLLISVVMPTRDRRRPLEEAIESVERQSYTRWELLVVNDGSADGTAEFLREIEDPRVRVLDTGGVGPCRARNAALDEARGDLIAYLDDDNLFDRHWLKAVAWTFEALPETQVCYGARVFDDEGRAMRGTINGRPGIHFLPWDPDAVLTQNLTDMNVLAHRRCGARFDEELPYYGDWDLLLQLTRESPPLELPAVAAYYRTHVPGRISATLELDEMRRQYAIVREKLGADMRS